MENNWKGSRNVLEMHNIANWPLMADTAETLNSFLYRFGVPRSWQIMGAMSSEPTSPLLIPSPVDGVIFQFPFNEQYEKHREAQQKQLEAEPKKCPENLFFVRQATRHGCAVYALIHLLANSKRITLESGRMKTFIEDTKEYNPEERGKLAVSGEPPLTNRPTKRNQNFVAFVMHEDVLYELDGCKTAPIAHGSTTDETFVQDVAKVINKLVKQAPQEPYAVLVLGPILKSE